MTEADSINLYHNHLLAMNTRLDVVFWGKKQGQFENAFQKISLGIQQLELVISRYNKEAELYKTNQQAYKNPVKLSSELFHILFKCYDFCMKTNGYFDISLGKLYHSQKNEHPTKTQADKSFDDRILLNKEDTSIRFLLKDTVLDLGGLGKGMALKKIETILNEYTIQNAFISFGGSSVLTKGRHPHGEFWPFALENNSHNFQLKLNNDFVSVSKSQNNHIHHIVNPKTGEAIAKEFTVIVKSNDPVLAEVITTVLIAAPKEEHPGILKNFDDIECWIF